MTPAVLAALAQCARKCARSSDGRTAAGAEREAVGRLLGLGYSLDAAMADAAAMRRIGAAIRLCAARRAAAT